MAKVSRLIRKHLLDIEPYSSARDDYDGSAEIFLDANENSLGSVYKTRLNRYPDPHYRLLRQKLAELKKVNPENVFLGNGSDEAIDLLIRAFCEPKEDSIIIQPPTYGMYAVSAKISDVGVKSIPLTDQLEIDLERLLSQSNQNDKLVFVCSPNNPTGNLLRKSSIIKLLEEFEGLVVIDEAYIDFAESEGFVKSINQYPNLVVLQTFSKAWGLAGIRLGMAYAHSEVINILETIKPPYNVDQNTQEIGLSALNDKDNMDNMATELRTLREKLRKELQELPVVAKIFQSDANFLLTQFKDHHLIKEYLLKNGVIVRDRSSQLYCDQSLRITVGTEQENKRLIELLKQYG